MTQYDRIHVSFERETHKHIKALAYQLKMTLEEFVKNAVLVAVQEIQAEEAKRAGK